MQKSQTIEFQNFLARFCFGPALEVLYETEVFCMKFLKVFSLNVKSFSTTGS